MELFKRNKASVESKVPAPSPPRAWIEKLVFSNGVSVTTSQRDILVIVGPNNTGKSVALRAIREKLEDSATMNPVVEKIVIGRSGSKSDVTAWLDEWTVKEVDRFRDKSFNAFRALYTVRPR